MSARGDMPGESKVAYTAQDLLDASPRLTDPQASASVDATRRDLLIQLEELANLGWTPEHMVKLVSRWPENLPVNLSSEVLGTFHDLGYLGCSPDETLDWFQAIFVPAPRIVWGFALSATFVRAADEWVAKRGLSDDPNPVLTYVEAFRALDIERQMEVRAAAAGLTPDEVAELAESGRLTPETVDVLAGLRRQNIR